MPRLGFSIAVFPAAVALKSNDSEEIEVQNGWMRPW